MTLTPPDEAHEPVSAPSGAAGRGASAAGGGGSLDLLSKRLIVVSGKGGVGKTVISSALGLLASRQGLNVLLIKIDDQGRTAQLFESEPLGDQVRPLRENVSAVNLDPITVVSEFLQRQLRVKTLVRHIVGSTLFQNWFRVSPAIKEMILLGRVWALVEERSWWRNRPTWDLVIFDAPATGHGLGLLGLPEQASKLLIGPMRSNALAVKALLQNPLTTSVVLVTIPEEMPVNETVHFYEQAKQQLDTPLAAVILNAVPPRRLDGDDPAPATAALQGPAGRAALGRLLGDAEAARRAVTEAVRWSVERRALAERYREELRERVPLPLLEVPHLFAESFGFAELELVAGALDRALTAARERVQA